MNDLTYPGGLTADATNEIERASSPFLESILGHTFPVLDHGFIRVIDYMGDEPAIVQAARVSYGRGTKTVNEDRGLIRYLMRHRHTTPFEMCEIKLHVKLPIFVARQWIRHRTANVNEYSARYSILAREFYVPEPEHIAPQSTTNRQGRDGSYQKDDREFLHRVIEEACTGSFDVYDDMIREDGYSLSRELARVVLPMSTYTEWYWKVDLHNLLHFLSLRADPHAQFEIRAYAEVICTIVSQWCPNVWKAFEDYVVHACTFSRQEMDAIRSYIRFHGPEGLENPKNVSKREFEDFTRKLELK